MGNGNGNGELIGSESGYELLESGKTLVKTDVKFMTAMQVQKPRNIAECLQSLEVIINRMPEALFYSWDIKTRHGRKTVEGGTIILANMLASTLGNNIIDSEIVSESCDHWIIKAYYIDLETGATNTRLFRQRKTQVEGRYDEDRKLDITFQIAQSKAKRNVILESVYWIANHCIEKAKKIERQNIEGDLKEYKVKCLQYFKDLGLAQAALEEKVGRKIEDWDGGDVLVMRGYARAIQDGECKVEDIFQKKKQTNVDVDLDEKDMQDILYNSSAVIEPEVNDPETNENAKKENPENNKREHENINPNIDNLNADKDDKEPLSTYNELQKTLIDANRENVISLMTRARSFFDAGEITEDQLRLLIAGANARLTEIKNNGGSNGKRTTNQ